ncbi:MAG: transcription antitermination factor NusB [Treponema sp.]|nr:transcription antitermination factor NusB [Treponema sp.]MBR7079027.1 transcription antitermination factor NusB [Treponema sp.]
MSRRKGRILAFQALYSYDVGGESLEQLLKLEWADLKESEKDADTVDFARILISGTINHIEEVDEVIKRHLTQNWEFSRVNKVSLAILRISCFTLLFQPEIHPTIVIDEAIDIAREYGADESYKFINAVLDHIRKEKEVED